MLTTNHHERDTIIVLIKEEHLRLSTLKQVINLINTNNVEILGLYKESKDTHAKDWGALAWEALPDWEQQPPVPLQPALVVPPPPPNAPLPNNE